MPLQEFLASYAVQVDEDGARRLQKILEQNRTSAGQLAGAFESAYSALKKLKKELSDTAGMRNVLSVIQGNAAVSPRVSSALSGLSGGSASGSSLSGVGAIAGKSVLSISANLNPAEEALSGFRSRLEAERPRLNVNATGITMAVSSAISQIRTMMSSVRLTIPVTAKAILDSSGLKVGNTGATGASGSASSGGSGSSRSSGSSSGGSGSSSGFAAGSSGNLIRLGIGGRVSRPTMAMIAEEGSPEYVIPTDNDARAVTLLRSLLSELSSSAKKAVLPWLEGEGNHALPLFTISGENSQEKRTGLPSFGEDASRQKGNKASGDESAQFASWKNLLSGFKRELPVNTGRESEKVSPQESGQILESFSAVSTTLKAALRELSGTTSNSPARLTVSASKSSGNDAENKADASSDFLRNYISTIREHTAPENPDSAYSSIPSKLFAAIRERLASENTDSAASDFLPKLFTILRERISTENKETASSSFLSKLFTARQERHEEESTDSVSSGFLPKLFTAMQERLASEKTVSSSSGFLPKLFIALRERSEAEERLPSFRMGWLAGMPTTAAEEGSEAVQGSLPRIPSEALEAIQNSLRSALPDFSSRLLRRGSILNDQDQSGPVMRTPSLSQGTSLAGLTDSLSDMRSLLSSFVSSARAYFLPSSTGASSPVSNSVQAPVNIHVTAAPGQAEAIGQRLYDVTERSLLKTLQGVFA